MTSVKKRILTGIKPTGIPHLGNYLGAIKPALLKLEELGLTDIIRKTIRTGKPFLGICLGYQLLFDSSDEGGGVTTALGLLKGQVLRFKSLKVPHMGWNQISFQPNLPLAKGLKDGSYMYFCHSYYVQPQDSSVITMKTSYGIDFASAICKDNVWAVQFHPEKSQKNGLQVLKNFIHWNG